MIFRTLMVNGNYLFCSFIIPPCSESPVFTAVRDYNLLIGEICKHFRLFLNTLKTAYFNSTNTKHILICINMRSGSHLSAIEETNIYSTLYCRCRCWVYWVYCRHRSQTVAGKMNDTPGLVALKTPANSM